MLMNLLHNTRRILRENPNLKRACEKLQKENMEMELVLEAENGYKKSRHYKRAVHAIPTKAERKIYAAELEEELYGNGEIVVPCDEI